MELSRIDLETLDEKGITPEKLEKQLEMLRNGFPFLRLEGPATLGHGISEMSPEMELGAVTCWDEFLNKGGKVIKMVPASGAASRMFKDLYAFLNGESDKPNTDFLRKFFDYIDDFAFFPYLNYVTLTMYEKSVLTLLHEKRYKDVVRALLEKPGMGYGSLPKALLRFHKVLGAARTPIEEHLVEGAQYAMGKDGFVNVHFTVSPEHLPLVKMKVEETARSLGREFGVKFNVTYSVQKPSTDTIAALPDGSPFRENEKLFFRPGGHGALIENLNDLDADVIFIKNIDNLTTDEQRFTTVHFKKILGGTLVAVKQRINAFCEELENEVPTRERLDEILHFVRNVLYIRGDRGEEMSDKELAEYLFAKLNRPVRVCGMVRNSGEPGGGPFLVYNPDGTYSPQILESSQINPQDKEAVRMLKESTHFNPVDLAVATRNYKGKKFHLPDFVDPTTGFISDKSREGVEFKALELPGLWNGAMSDWNTILIEVPADTFSPVKTVNDLLRPPHQPLRR